MPFDLQLGADQAGCDFWQEPETGLIWMRDPVPGAYTHPEALDLVRSYNTSAGLAEGAFAWRFPTDDEFHRVLRPDQSPPFLTDAFPSLARDLAAGNPCSAHFIFWCSTRPPDEPNEAFQACLLTGGISSDLVCAYARILMVGTAS